MIVRILDEGQYELPESEVEGLQRLDVELEQAVDSGEEGRFRAALGALLARVRQVGTPLPESDLDTSDAILPGADASVAEVRALLLDDGVIPGY